MVARKRLLARLREQGMLVAVLLVITVGLPLIARYAGKDPASIPHVARLDQAGWYVLRAAPLVLLAQALFGCYRLQQRQAAINREMAEQGATYLILPRPDAPAARAERVTLWHRIAEALPPGEHVAFEVGGDEQGMVYALRATRDELARVILAKVVAEAPGTQVRRAGAEIDRDPLEDMDGSTCWIELVPQHKEQPLLPATTDPSLALLAEMALLPRGTRAGLQLLVRRDPYTRLDLARTVARRTSRKPDSGPYALRPSSEEKRDLQRLDQRARESFLEARLLLWVAADDAALAGILARQLADSLSSQYQPGNGLRAGRKGEGSLRARRFPTFAGSAWTAGELGVIAHLVGGDARTGVPRLRFAPARPLPASPASYFNEARHRLAPHRAPPVRWDPSDLPDVVLEP